MINSNSSNMGRKQAWQRVRTALAAGMALTATAMLGGLQPAQADAVGGPKFVRETVKAHTVDVYHVAFRGGEIAEVALSGDGDTDIDLFIYDENGNLVAEDRDRSDDCLARWYVKRTGTYTVRVRNQGGVYNDYVMATN